VSDIDVIDVFKTSITLSISIPGGRFLAHAEIFNLVFLLTPMLLISPFFYLFSGNYRYFPFRLYKI